MDMYKQTLIYLYAFFVCLSLRANYFHKNETLEMSTPNIFAKNGLNNNFASSFLFCFDFENYNLPIHLTRFATIMQIKRLKKKLYQTPPCLQFAHK